MKINRCTAAAIIIFALILTGCQSASAGNVLVIENGEVTVTVGTVITEEIPPELIPEIPEEIPAVIIKTETETTNQAFTESKKALITEMAETTAVKYIYELPAEFYTDLEALTYKYSQFGEYDISFAYFDLLSGFTLEFNPDAHYYIASVIKAPYSMYIYRKAMAGEVDLERKITYTPSFKKDGTGVIKDMEFGIEFTIDELIRYAIEWSDNSAYAMLRSVIPEDGYIEYTKTLGVFHNADLQNKNIEKICTQSALCYGRALYDFFEEHNEYSERLKGYMLNTRNAMIYSSSPVVRKYGWYEGYFHDLAVIYAERPYVLSIMGNFASDKPAGESAIDNIPPEYSVQAETVSEGAGSSEFALYRELSLLFDRYCGLLDEISVVEAEEKDIFQVSVILELSDIQTVATVEEEVKEDSVMQIPSDPVILLSFINTRLRDNYSSLTGLCDDLELDITELTNELSLAGYVYNNEINQFVPK